MSRPLSIAELTIRDWFAGQAMIQLIAERPDKAQPDDVAFMSYAYADAMIAARKYTDHTTKEKNERGN
jgi:hypothetical protein